MGIRPEANITLKNQNKRTMNDPMPEPWSDRQVILAIALTLILVVGLILGTVGHNREQQTPMLWRDTPQTDTSPLEI